MYCLCEKTSANIHAGAYVVCLFMSFLAIWIILLMQRVWIVAIGQDGWYLVLCILEFVQCLIHHWVGYLLPVSTHIMSWEVSLRGFIPSWSWFRILLGRTVWYSSLSLLNHGYCYFWASTWLWVQSRLHVLIMSRIHFHMSTNSKALLFHLGNSRKKMQEPASKSHVCWWVLNPVMQFSLQGL